MTSKKTVQFFDPRQTKNVELPSFKWSDVIVYTSMLSYQQKTLMEKYRWFNLEKDKDKAIDFFYDMLLVMIKDWNFTSAEDPAVPLDISIESLKMFPQKDLDFLSDQIEWSDEKKNQDKENEDPGVTS